MAWSPTTGFEELYEMIAPLSEKQTISLEQFHRENAESDDSLEEMKDLHLSDESILVEERNQRHSEIKMMMDYTPGIFSTECVLDSPERNENHSNYPPVMYSRKLPLLIHESYFKFSDDQKPKTARSLSRASMEK